MTRTSKQAERRNQFPRKHKKPSVKTGPVKDKLALGFKEHGNAFEGVNPKSIFIAKIK